MTIVGTDVDPVTTYRQRKMLGERLRRRSEQLSTLEDSPSVITGSGYGGQPIAAKINYGGILGNAFKSYMLSKGLSDAEKAGEESQAARDAALESITPESLDRITPAQAVRLQELGIDVGDLKSFQPKKEPLANLLQNIDSLSESSADVLAPQYGMDAEQLRTMIRDAKAQKAQASEEEFKRKKLLTELGITPREKSDYEIYMELGPEKYAQFKGAGKSGGSDGNKFNEAAEKAAGKAAGENVAGAVDVQAKQERNNAFRQELMGRVTAKKQLGGTGTAVKDWAGKAVGMEGEFKPSNMFNKDLSLRNQRAAQYAIDAASQLRGQGQVTENERAMIKATQFYDYDDDEAILKKLDRIDEIVKTNAERAARSAKALESGNMLDMMNPSGGQPTGGWSIKQVR